MRVLAIDSSGLTATVAIVEDDTTIAEFTINYKKTHSQTLLPMIDEMVKRKRPYIIHRTAMGCYERTLAWLIEKYAGLFPTWLCPEQVRVLPISEKYHDYANKSC